MPLASCGRLEHSHLVSLTARKGTSPNTRTPHPIHPAALASQPYTEIQLPNFAYVPVGLLRPPNMGCSFILQTAATATVCETKVVSPTFKKKPPCDSSHVLKRRGVSSVSVDCAVLLKQTLALVLFCCCVDETCSTSDSLVYRNHCRQMTH